MAPFKYYIPLLSDGEQIVMKWASWVAYQRGLPQGCAKIQIFGSYGLGVHDPRSDIDVLCVVQEFITSEDFFGVLRNVLARTRGVKNIICIKNARVPQLKFSIDGVKFDLPCANAPSIDEAVDVLNPFLLQDIDETSRKSMSGVVTNEKILQLTRNIEEYRPLLRCVKYWAKRRGIYGYPHGYFGGVHLAVLAAFICLRQPNAPLSVLVFDFFYTYAFWRWPEPIILEDDNMPPNNIDQKSLMPIQHCYSNITKSTFNIIKTEFQRAHVLTKDFLVRYFDWRPLFELVSYEKDYKSFLKICVSVSSRHKNDLGGWVGWVKSRMRQLLFKLDKLPGFCHPNPTTYGGSDLSKVFYWGLDTNKSNNINVNVESIKKDFMRILKGRHGPIGTMELSVVNSSEFPEAKTNNRSTSMIASNQD